MLAYTRRPVDACIATYDLTNQVIGQLNTCSLLCSLCCQLATTSFYDSDRPDRQAEALCLLPVRPFVCLFVRYHQTCEHDILKTGPIVMQIGTSGPRGKGMKTVNLGVRMSKVKVTGVEDRFEDPMKASFSTPF